MQELIKREIKSGRVTNIKAADIQPYIIGVALLRGGIRHSLRLPVSDWMHRRHLSKDVTHVESLRQPVLQYCKQKLLQIVHSLLSTTFLLISLEDLRFTLREMSLPPSPSSSLEACTAESLTTPKAVAQKAVASKR